MARCSCWGSFTSFISTRSTLMPHGSVASSRDSCRGQYVTITNSSKYNETYCSSFLTTFSFQYSSFCDKPHKSIRCDKMWKMAK
uniref:Uncharacterized protein n=1 Tax=Salarias fasciatus TaxID=181472 RepID=A0A672F3C9_SALFA